MACGGARDFAILLLLVLAVLVLALMAGACWWASDETKELWR